MNKISNQELKNIQGGGLSASLITGLVRGVNTILDLGRSLGTIIRRIQTGRLC